MYEFKLMNREVRKGKTGSTTRDNLYPFMALVKKDNYFQPVAIKFDFSSTTTQSIHSNNKQLLEIKKKYSSIF